jgi:hypothetical protein
MACQRKRCDMKAATVSESAFETVIETHLLQYGCLAIQPAGFDRERALFPDACL